MMKKVCRRYVPYLLLAVFFVTTISTNLYLASWLPVVVPPLWANETRATFHKDGRSRTVRRQPTHTKLLETPVPIQRHDGGDIFHVVTTRFMQMQADLVALGDARLKLFETFCLPSMLGQSTKDFIWVIYTDPALDPTMMQRLFTLLSPHKNFYLVLSNENAITTNDFDSLKDMISTGDKELFHSLLSSRSRKLLLQTRIDADDGLGQHALSEIQDMARKHTFVDSDSWQVICVNLHFEWRSDNLGPNNKNNNTVVKNKITFGRLRVVQEHICVTPGYTLVKQRNETEFQLPLAAPPRVGHHEIVRVWPECSQNNTTSFTYTTTSNKSISNTTMTNCWTKLSHYPTAIRSRTITSAGMSRIDAPEEAKYDNHTEEFWKYVKRDFGTSPEQAIEISYYLRDHFTGIVMDNLRGQW